MLRALGLGDFLTGVPALRALRRGLPGHELVLAAPAVLRPLVDRAGVADRLLPTAGLRPLAWRAEPPALAVNLHGTGPQSHALLRALNPGRLVAFDCPDAHHAGPRWTAEEHEASRWCRLVRESLEIPADPADLLLDPPDVEPVAPGAVVVHPGAAYPSRRWPPERFADVARWADREGHRVVVTGGPQERDLAERVAASAGLPSEAVLAGRTDLRQLAALVAAARLVVCGDTGVAHLASAFAAPSVLLFGPTPPSRWGPPPDGPHLVLWHGDGSGDPWAQEVDPALLRVSVEEVLAAAALVTRGRSAPGRRTTPASA